MVSVPTHCLDQVRPSSAAHRRLGWVRSVRDRPDVPPSGVTRIRDCPLYSNEEPWGGKVSGGDPVRKEVTSVEVRWMGTTGRGTPRRTCTPDDDGGKGGTRATRGRDGTSYWVGRRRRGTRNLGSVERDSTDFSDFPCTPTVPST